MFCNDRFALSSLYSCRGLNIPPKTHFYLQTLANVYLALDNNLEVIPVLNKIDLPAAEPDKVKEEIEQKIADLKSKKTSLEEELQKAKAWVEKEFEEKRKEFEPRIEESKGFFKESLKQLALAFKSLFGKK